MTYEDFLAFFYPALFILGALLSTIPAYLASKKNKNFWNWWIGTTAVFWVLLFVLIQIQAISMLIYSLLVLVIASILALKPKSDRVQADSPLLAILKKGKAVYATRGLWLFLSTLLVMLIVSEVLYHFLALGSILGPTELLRYYATKRAIFFMASLGFASFMFVVSEKRIRYILVNIALVTLLSVPFFQKPSRAYGTLNVTEFFFRTDILLGVLITDLIRNPAVGIFVLIGICSGCIAILIVLNDKYKFAPKFISAGITIVLMISNVLEPYLPILRFSSPTSLLPYIMAGILLFMLGSWLEIAGIFVMGLIGAVFSSMVIRQAIKQQKILAVIIIFMFGLVSSVRLFAYQDEASTMMFIGLFIFPFMAPVLLIVVYGLGAGFASLILWVISNVSNRSNDNNNLSE